MSDATLISRLLDVIEQDIAPLTRQGVTLGNKLFGAAILRKADLSLVIAETNNEVENPLWHGEMHAIKKLYERPRSDVPDPRDCIFLATHEPCSLCLSAITWAGYDNFWYLFSHLDSRDSFDIPHDLKILKEVFGLDAGEYRSKNAFWTGRSIRGGIAGLPEPDRAALEARVAGVRATYDELSGVYQSAKGSAGIPLA